MFQEKMREIVEEMDTLPGMSSGWLHKFRNRHMIRFRQISGESVSVITTITDEWKHCLPTIVNGYNDDDVHNADETALI